jgi:hypothetical protein
MTTDNRLWEHLKKPTETLELALSGAMFTMAGYFRVSNNVLNKKSD